MNFFGIVRLFRFFFVSKGSPFNFLIFAANCSFKKHKGSPLFRFFFGIMRFTKFFFSLKLGFLNIYPQIILFNTFQNFDVISGVKRYIQTFDVIPEVSCVLLRRRRRRSRIKKSACICPSTLYPNF